MAIKHNPSLTNRIMSNKGIFFSIDAILAATLILVVIIISSSFYIAKKPEISLQIYSSDLLRVLKELKIQEVDENEVVKTLINQSYITNKNNSILDQIGELWSEGNFGQARNLTKEFAEDYIYPNLNFNIMFDDDIIFNSTNINSSNFQNLGSSYKIISGISRNKTKEGYTARASAIKITKNTTKVFPFIVGGSGNGNANEIFFTKKFYLDIGDDDDIINSTLYLSIHRGTSSLEAQNKVNINDGECDFKLSDMMQIDTLEYDNTNRDFLKKDITSCLQEGWNTVNVTLFGQSFHRHFHPGSKIDVAFRMEELQNISKIVKKKVYFDNIIAGSKPQRDTGAWAILPLFNPESYNMINATLHINGKGIQNTPNKDNVQIYLNNLTLEKTDPPCGPNQECDFEKTYDLFPNLTKGTNVISVYFNTYNEEFWANGIRTLYSDPENDPLNSSFIEYEYEIINPKLQFGNIDISINERFNTPRSNNVTHMKLFDNTLIYESSVEMVQLDSDLVNLKVNGYSQFITPTTLATPNSIFIDPESIISGINQFHVEDNCSYCYVLNYTSLYYTILVPSLVGYGGTFETELEAREDAEQRLEEVLGDYVEALEIDDEILVMSKVPSMWGPTIAKVNVWE